MTAESPTVTLTMDLIGRPSVTPEDAGCQAMLMERLEALGFTIEKLRFKEVSNFWARRGTEAPLFVFAGHTDVVPPGPMSKWDSAPFEPEIRVGRLYGRGAADMKGSLAAMITASERFIAAHGDHYRGSIAFLITSDEEGPGINGTVKVVKHLSDRGDSIDWCLVGEPTSSEQVGDVIKNGRRGSLTGMLKILGVQGHIAYPHHADNPVHRFAPALAALCGETWDQGNEFFPPTTFQISSIQAAGGSNNVTPGELELKFNFRYSNEVTYQELQQHVTALLDRFQLNYELDWSLSGEPFLTPRGELVDATVAAIGDVTGQDAELSTSGGTSDGRFIAPSGAQVVELGPVNKTIHQINECCTVSELDTLSRLYERILERLLLEPKA